MRVVLVLLFLLQLMSMSGQDLSINEFMSSNDSGIFDEDGDRSDWIELYNSSNTTIDLSGWFLSDDVNLPQKWEIAEAEIAPNGYLLVFASSKNHVGPGELHTNFKIQAEGEMLLLSAPNGAVIQVVLPVALSANFSFGSLEDGDIAEQVSFGLASPGVGNENGQVVTLSSDELSFSQAAGFYADEFELELLSAQGGEIRYTTDGSEPMGNSPLYTGPIEIEDRFGAANDISLIPTGENWVAPRLETEKATVIRAASFSQGIRLTPIQTASYFISDRLNSRYAGVPVISISLDADSLFNPTYGIYVEGDEGLENYYENGGEWERRLNLEYFDSDRVKQIDQVVGGRIHGNSSRAHPQKTIRLYAREEYGASTIEYPFFEDKDFNQFKRILLRNSSTDFGNTMFKDILCSRLVKDLDMDYMAAKVCIVFINGEYWGVQSIRERIDKFYVAQNHGVSPDSLDMLAIYAIAEAGSNASYNDMLSYVQSNDLSQAIHYDYVADRVDLDNFIDYNISQLFFANYDWPQVNIRFWKAWSDEHKWRWIFYDCDRCMVLPGYDYLWNYVLDDIQYNDSPEWTTLLFNRLLTNEKFKEAFVQRFFYLLNTTFRADNMLNELDELEQLYAPLMIDHIERWSYPSSFNTWAESITELRGFILKRPAVMIQQVMEYMGEQYSLYPNPVHASAGYVNLDMELSSEVSTSIEVYSMMGQLVHTQELNAQSENVHPQISISDLKAGVYVVRINYGTLLFSEMLIVD